MTMVLAACQNIGDFRGTWTGSRVGSGAPLSVGIPQTSVAGLEIFDLDTHGLKGSLSVPGLANSAGIESVPGAEADALANMTFAGSPVRVYVAFVPTIDGGGDAVALIALYEDRRVEVRLLRGGSVSIYAIFALTEA